MYLLYYLNIYYYLDYKCLQINYFLYGMTLRMCLFMVRENTGHINYDKLLLFAQDSFICGFSGLFMKNCNIKFYSSL